jgi:SPP1 gp7 family putative phage head morphogenesis protein
VQGVVKSGYLNGRTVSEMVKDLRPLVDGLLKREAEALVRTATQFYANQGREQFAVANKDLLSERVYWSILDNRTTLICMGRHLQKWPIDATDYPQIPAHFGCRSQWLFLVEGQEMPDGMKPTVGGKDTKEAEEAFKAQEDRTGKKPKYKGRKDLNKFAIEQVKANTKFDTWLKRQPDWFIKDTLGETRAKLFLEGKMSLSSFTDMAGRTLRLDELAARDAAAFARAGIKP